MKCQRCLSGEEAKYRVYTELMEMKVCVVCADEARKLGIAVEVLDPGEGKNNATKSEFEGRDYRLKLLRYGRECRR